MVYFFAIPRAGFNVATESLAERSFYDKLFYHMEIMSSIRRELNKQDCTTADIIRAHAKVSGGMLSSMQSDRRSEHPCDLIRCSPCICFDDVGLRRRSCLLPTWAQAHVCAVTTSLERRLELCFDENFLS